MNKKVRIVSSEKIIEEGRNTYFVIPKSNFWSVFKNCGFIDKKEGNRRKFKKRNI